MRIGLLGCGVVGKGVVDLIQNNEIVKILVIDVDEGIYTTHIEDVLNSNIDLCIECLPGIEPAATYVRMMLEAGIPVVTSNKSMLATHYEEFITLANKHHVTLSFEASVAGGIPWLHTLYDLKKTDEIKGFRGIMNGTTNYILDKMNKESLSFDTALKMAQKLGYAEADPTNDIEGYDVKYKVALTLNLIYDTCINLNEMIVFGIRHINTDVLKVAASMNKTIKLIGYGDKENAFVIPMFVSNEDQIAHTNLNYNFVEVFSQNLTKTALIGQGAGRYPTANAILSDVERPFENVTIKNKLELKQNKEMAFFLSEKAIDETYIDASLPYGFITKKMSIKELNEKLQDRNLFVGALYDQSM